MLDENIAEQEGATSASVTAEGTLLSDIHRRLVPLHLSLATADAVDRNFQRRLMHELMDVLREIEENPEFRAAHEAEQERRRLHPTPEEKAAQERNRAIVERFLKAREERRAHESAETSAE